MVVLCTFLIHLVIFIKINKYKLHFHNFKKIVSLILLCKTDTNDKILFLIFTEDWFKKWSSIKIILYVLCSWNRSVLLFPELVICNKLSNYIHWSAENYKILLKKKMKLHTIETNHTMLL